MNIGQYRIVDKLGTGGMGTVFLGEHILLGRPAAIKMLRPALSAQREVVERFFNEARATSAISDPGVVQVFDFGYHVDGTAYIVMELLDGEPVAARIHRVGRLRIGDALRIARQVAGSLAAAHARGIVHRDLKPANIFLSRDPHEPSGERTKLLDFGICKLELDGPRVTGSDACLGTPVYMAPEQCRDARAADARSDIYALGGVLFHMLTGRTPFICESSGDYIAAHLLEDAPAPAKFVDVPPALDALVVRCLAKAPGDRFQSMAELQAAIDDVLGAVPTRISMEAAAPMQVGFDSHQSWFLSSTPLPATTLEPVATHKRGIGRIVFAGALAAIAGVYLMVLHDDGVALGDIVESTRRDVALQVAVQSAESASIAATDAGKPGTGPGSTTVGSTAVDSTTAAPTTAAPTTVAPTTAGTSITAGTPTTVAPTTAGTPTTVAPTTNAPTPIDALRPVADELARTMVATIGAGWPAMVMPATSLIATPQTSMAATPTTGDATTTSAAAKSSPVAAKSSPGNASSTNVAAKSSPGDATTTSADAKSSPVAAKSSPAAAKSPPGGAASTTAGAKVAVKPAKPAAKPVPVRPAITHRPVLAKRPAIRPASPVAPPPPGASTPKPSEDLYETR